MEIPIQIIILNNQECHNKLSHQITFMTFGSYYHRCVNYHILILRFHYHDIIHF